MDSREFCTGHRPNVDVNLDVSESRLSSHSRTRTRLPGSVRDAYRKYGPSTRQFIYNYHTEIAHTHEYEAELTDHLFLRFFKVVASPPSLRPS